MPLRKPERAERRLAPQERGTAIILHNLEKQLERGRVRPRKRFLLLFGETKSKEKIFSKFLSIVGSITHLDH